MQDCLMKRYIFNVLPGKSLHSDSSFCCTKHKGGLEVVTNQIFEELSLVSVFGIQLNSRSSKFLCPEIVDFAVQKVNRKLSNMLDNNEKVTTMEDHGIIRRVKKHRRGKKKPCRELFNDLPSVSCEYGDQDRFMANRECEVQMITGPSKRGRRGQKLLRPPYSPKAPHNSTQFLIEDRLNANNGYHMELGFESPFYLDEPSLYGYNDLAQSEKVSVTKTSPSYPNIDFSCSPLEETDVASFMEKDFEDIFSCLREDSLAEKSKSELILDVHSLEERLQKTEHRFRLHHRHTGRQTQNTEYTSQNALLKELEKLKSENEHLKSENEYIKHGIDTNELNH